MISPSNPSQEGNSEVLQDSRPAVDSRAEVSKAEGNYAGEEKYEKEGNKEEEKEMN